MAVGGIGDYQVHDPIKEYQGAVGTHRGSVRQEDHRRQPSVPALPVARSSRTLQRPYTVGGDDLDYYDDGYPKLPACLDRGKPKLTLVVDNPIPHPTTDAA